MTAKLQVKSAKQIERLERMGAKIAGKSAAKPKRRASPTKKHPDREGQFLKLFLTKSQYMPERQYVFHPTRKWRFDFAWPREKVAVEIEGGIFQGSRTGHRSITGLINDLEKSNEAQMNGWLYLRYQSKELDQSPMQVINEVLGMIEIRSRMATKST